MVAANVKTTPTMTAREMALTSHNLGRNGMAKTSDGRKWVWQAAVELWARVK